MLEAFLIFLVAVVVVTTAASLFFAYVNFRRRR